MHIESGPRVAARAGAAGQGEGYRKAGWEACNYHSAYHKPAARLSFRVVSVGRPKPSEWRCRVARPETL